MNVLVLSQYYKPEPVPKPSEIAEELKARGHTVRVVTGFPNYPSGQLHPAYKLRPWLHEVLDGTPILRVFEMPYHGRSMIGRVVNYLSLTVAAAVGVFFGPRPDVAYVFLPPPTLALSAALLQSVRGVPFVCDVQDIWPDEAIASGLMRDGFVARAIRVVERLAYATAAHVLVITDGAKRNLIAKGTPADKISVLPHWYPSEMDADYGHPELREKGRQDLHADGEFIVTFAGNLGLVQGLSTVLDAAAELRGRANVSFRFVGDGVDRARLERIANERGLDNVEFLGPRPAAAMPPLLAASDALLVHAIPGPLNQLLLPTKTLAYLAAGRPVIAAMDGATADLVREAGAGVAVAPGDPAALADAIAGLSKTPPEVLAEMGARGRRFVVGRFAKKHVISQLEAVLATCARGRPRR